MFLNNSRYSGIETVEAKDRHGRVVRAVKLRRLPEISGRPTVIKANDRLDVMSDRQYQDATKFWHIGDANPELETNALTSTVERNILVPVN